MFGTPKFDSADAPAENTSDTLGANKTKASDDASTVSSRRSKTAPAAAPQKLRRSTAMLLTLGFIGSLATGFLGGYLGAGSQGDGTFTSNDIARQRQVVASESQLIAAIAKQVGPSVVSVNVVTQGNAQTDFFGFPVPGRQSEAAGTGIVISEKGLIVTNRHVVSDATDVSVTLSDGTKLEDVSVIGRTNPGDSLDIAFLKINDLNGNKLTPAEIGDSSKVQVGEVVVAIGNALGQFNNSVTSGIISGFGRSVQASEGGSSANVENLDDLFQTDAAINQGNSGGPLVNTDGQVIGINTAVAGDGQNIGFAIPINDVNGLIKQVLSTGKFERPYLGVRYVRLNADVAKQYDLDIDRGAYVLPSVDASKSSVLKDGPADKAGVREGDVITAIDNVKIDESHSLTGLIGRHQVGDTVRITVLREGKSINLSVKLEAMPDNLNS